jgi:dienelactone hydrolase
MLLGRLGLGQVGRREFHCRFRRRSRRRRVRRDFATASTEDYASDVRAGVEFLNQREDIRPDAVGLIGHSDGGIIAPMVAAASNDVA